MTDCSSAASQASELERVDALTVRASACTLMVRALIMPLPLLGGLRANFCRRAFDPSEM